MKNIRCVVLAIFAAVLLWAGAAQAQVHDNAGIFGQSAVDKANSAMTAMQEKHNKQFVVETFAKVPDDKLDQLQQLGDEQFFDQWLMERAQYENVNGVYALICMDPAHHYIDIRAGKNTTARGEFTNADAQRVLGAMKSDFHAKRYDQGLLQSVNEVEQIYTNNISARNRNSYSPAAAPAAAPTWTPPVYNNSMPYNNYNYHSSNGGGLGSLLCLFIGIVIVISIVRSIFHGGYRGYGGGGWGMGGGYGGYGGYGGGGGFGSGILGGLLGGVIGNEADRWMHGGSSGGGGFTGGSGGGFSGGSSGGGGGGGGSFDSGPSDFGGGFGGGGGDFGGGGAGAGGSF